MRPTASHVDVAAHEVPGLLESRRSAAGMRKRNKPHKSRLADLMGAVNATSLNQMSSKGASSPLSIKWAEAAEASGLLDVDALREPALPLEALHLGSYTARAHRYVHGVLTGSVVAGTRIKQICQRHAEDLARAAEDPAFPYRYDQQAAGKACLFIELLPHVKGKWAKNNELITLEGWQALFLCMLFGWVRKDTGLRRYSIAILFVGRKNAKSSLAAGIALYMTGLDGEAGPEVLCGATSEQQAEIVFDTAKAMLVKTPELCLVAGMVAYKSRITCMVNSGTFTTMIKKPGDGTNPHFAVVDEYHEHDTDEMMETMRTGMGAREQPILLVTTTAGDDIACPCYDFYGEAVKALSGTTTNDALLPFIFEPDAEDSWDSDDAMRKANPNLGVSVFKEHLVQMRSEALSDPRKINAYKRKHLNIWVNAGSPWVNTDTLLRCARRLKREDTQGYPVGVGIDLSSKNDLTARVTCVKVDKKYRFFTDVYLPEETVKKPEHTQYQDWQHGGHLHVTPGAIIDIQRMIDDLLRDAETLWRVQGVRFDPYNAQTMVPQLEDAGLMPVEVPQTVKYLSDPMKWLAALIDAGHVEYDGNPIFAWCFSNVEIAPDRNDNIFPRRNGRKAKIDVAVAAVMAFMAVYTGEDAVADIDAMIAGGAISGG
jgi:phage terminase large subunit-like protein